MRSVSVFLRDLLGPRLDGDVQAARARRACAHAALTERALEQRSELARTDDATPTAARTWTLETIRTPAGAPEIAVRLIGDAGRSHRISLTPSLAAGLCGALGHAVAEALPARPRTEPGKLVYREGR